jgi:hypothetical protein
VAYQRKTKDTKEKVEELTARARIGGLGTEYKELIAALIEEMRQEIYRDIEAANENQLLTLKARLTNLRVIEGKLNAVIQQGKSAQDKIIKGGE